MSDSPTDGVQPVEHADVLVVEVDVDVAVELPVGAEQLRLGRGVLLGERAQDRADVVAAGRAPPSRRPRRGAARVGS